jgi:hypothetical protein
VAPGTKSTTARSVTRYIALNRIEMCLFPTVDFTFQIFCMSDYRCEYLVNMPPEVV